MKATEVMLNDLVMCNNKVCKVCSIEGVMVLVSFKDGEKLTIEDNIEPIPLTPEILEKNGFGIIKSSSCATVYLWLEKVEGKTYATYTIEISIYPTPIHGVNILTRIDTPSSKGDGVSKLHSCDINYVHELQHALKLCGISKEIVI